MTGNGAILDFLRAFPDGSASTDFDRGIFKDSCCREKRRDAAL